MKPVGRVGRSGPYSASCLVTPARAHTPQVITDDIPTYVTNAKAAAAISSCFEGTSLLVALNLSNSLSFTDSLSTEFSSMSGFNVSKVRDREVGR